MAKKNYDDNSLKQLKGPDQVRLRPGVIFGSDGLDGCCHSVFEILSNSIDEAREGFGKKIIVTRFLDKALKCRNYGRGIPIDFNKKRGKRTLGACHSAHCTQAVNMTITAEITIHTRSALTVLAFARRSLRRSIWRSRVTTERGYTT